MVRLAAVVKPPGAVTVKLAGANASVGASNVTGRTVAELGFVATITVCIVANPCPATYPLLPGVQARIAPAPVVGQGRAAFSGWLF